MVCLDQIRVSEFKSNILWASDGHEEASLKNGEGTKVGPGTM
jgi:hypothetical protein